MIIKVIKRDGKIEDFDKKKIAKIAVATGLYPEKAKALANKVESRIKEMKVSNIKSTDIRDLVSEELQLADKYASGLYTWYEKTKDQEIKKNK